MASQHAVSHHCYFKILTKTGSLHFDSLL